MNDKLLVDFTSPLPTFSTSDLQDWGADRQVFISSTMRDLAEERERAAEAIREMGAEPRHFEGFSDTGSPESVYMPEVGRADIVVLILGERYGTPVPKDGRSPTHIEYDVAREAFKPLLVYRKQGVDREPRLEEFLRQLESDHTVARFRSLDQLAKLLREGLGKQAQRDSVEWVKLGRAIFPTSHRRRQGARISVRTSTQDPAIIKYLRDASSFFHFQGSIVVGTQVLKVARIEVAEESRGRHQREHVIDVELAHEFNQSPTKFPLHHMTQVTYNGAPPSQWCQAYVRSLLFGDPMPDHYRPAGRYTDREERPVFELPEIYQALRDQERADELFSAVGRIYLVDRLIRGAGQENGITNHVRQAELGPIYDGKTRVRLVYEIPAVHGQAGTEDLVEGEIVLEEPQPKRVLKDWR